MNTRHRPLVLGAKGLLGQHVVRALNTLGGAGFAITSKQRIESPADLDAVIDGTGSCTVINCIGYFGVDAALSWRINASLPRWLADAVERCSGRVIHVSTNAVFRPSEDRKWLPGDPLAPQSDYEFAKAAGEDPRAYIVRASFIGAGARRETIWDRLVAGAGYHDRVWNGVTVLALAERLAELALDSDAAKAGGIEHVHSPEVMTFAEVARQLRSPSTATAYRHDGRLLGGGPAMPAFPDQLERYLALQTTPSVILP